MKRLERVTFEHKPGEFIEKIEYLTEDKPMRKVTIKVDYEDILNLVQEQALDELYHQTLKGLTAEKLISIIESYKDRDIVHDDKVQIARMVINDALKTLKLTDKDLLKTDYVNVTELIPILTSDIEDEGKPYFQYIAVTAQEKEWLDKNEDKWRE